MKAMWSRTFIAVAAALGALLAGATAQAADLSFQCTNTASGTSWMVKVDDQKRTVDVAQAFANGADYIVVGRPIRDAADPRAAAESIQASILASCGGR
jgi:hypothetical protein